MSRLLTAEQVCDMLQLSGRNRIRYWLERLSHDPKYKPAEFALSDGPKAKRRWVESKMHQIIYAGFTPEQGKSA